MHGSPRCSAKKYSFIDKLVLIATTSCNINCKHCSIINEDIPVLSERDSEPIKNILLETNINTIQFTGGETTLVLDNILQLIQFLKPDISNLGIEIITNAHFAGSIQGCKTTLDAILGLKKVIASYDLFHADFIPIKNINNLIEYCRGRDILIEGYAAISSPEDFAEMLQCEANLGIKFFYQRVLPLGNALKNNVFYKYHSFEPETLEIKCPNPNSLIYVPSFGVTNCCSLLLLRNAHVRKKITFPNIDSYLSSKYFDLINTSSMKDLLNKCNTATDDLPPIYSHCCEICYNTISKLLDN